MNHFNYSSNLNRSITKCLLILSQKICSHDKIVFNNYLDTLYLLVKKLKDESYFKDEIIEDFLIDFVELLENNNFILISKIYSPVRHHQLKITQFLINIINYFNLHFSLKLVIFFKKLNSELKNNLGHDNVKIILQSLNYENILTNKFRSLHFNRSNFNMIRSMERLNLNNVLDPKYYL